MRIAFFSTLVIRTKDKSKKQEERHSENHKRTAVIQFKSEPVEKKKPKD